MISTQRALTSLTDPSRICKGGILPPSLRCYKQKSASVLAMDMACCRSQEEEKLV
jgi:hypothetical protein